MASVDITRYIRGFKIKTADVELWRQLEMFNENLIQPKMPASAPKWGTTPVEEKGDLFYFFNEYDRTFHYIDPLWETVMQVIDTFKMGRGLAKIEVNITKVNATDGKSVNFQRHNLSVYEEEGSRFDYQNPIVKYVTREGYNHDVLELQTGSGKTAIAMKAMIAHGKRTIIITKPAYLDKWTDDLTKKSPSLNLRPGELIKIVGVKSVDALFEMGNDGSIDGGKGLKECKVILMSSKTLELWFQKLALEKSEYNVEGLIPATGTGLIVYDESHEFFRMNYISFVLLNAARVIDLTATIVPSTTFIKRRYDERFPALSRYNGLEYNKYIDAYSIYYHTDNKKLLQRIMRLKMYNHIEFEKVILKGVKMLKAYFDMVDELLNLWYFKEYKEGQRVLVYFASQIMCTKFAEYLTEKYPKFKVERFIQGDNYQTFLAADIGVSTPGKSGTAVDIPGLIMTICTVALGKEDKNLQILGRTRELTKWDMAPKAVFLHCQQINKHCKYLQRRQKIFEGKVKSFKTLNSKFRI